MKRKVCALLCLAVAIIGVTGCSVNLPIPGLNKDEEVVEEQPTEEPIELTILSTDEVLGYSSASLLTQITTYPQIVITYYNEWMVPTTVESYTVDSVSRTGVKYWYDQENIGTTYYDNYTNKAWTNEGMVEWNEVTGQRLDNLTAYINADKFHEEEYTYDDDWVYVKGSIDVYTDKSTVMQSIYKHFPDMTALYIDAVYDRETKELFRMEITVTASDIEYKVGVTPSMEVLTVKIPQKIIDGETEVKEQDNEINTIPMDTWLWSALYILDNNEGINREYVIESYDLIASEVEKKYEGIDVESFIQTIIDTGNTYSVAEFLEAYNAKLDEEDTEHTFASIDEQAAYEYIHEKLIDIDETIEDKAVKTLIAKPDEEENPDGESGEEQPVEEVEQEKVYKKTTTNVNMRSGPGTSYEKLGKVPEGTQVEILGTAEEDSTWSKVLTPDGVECYLKNDYLID